MSSYQTQRHRRRYPATHQRPAKRHAVAVANTGADAKKNIDELKEALGRALHLWPSECGLDTIHRRNQILCFLNNALRNQRRLALQAHWAYDVAAHARLADLKR